MENRVTKFKESEKVKGDSRKRMVKLESKVSSPVLWSPESPNFTSSITTVEVDGKVG